MRLILFLFLGSMTLSGCTAVLVGGAAAIGVDAIVEDQQGGDGLF